MRVLHRICAWGLLAGWLILAFGAKTIRGDAAGIWVLLDPILVIGMGVLLISSIGACVATFQSRPTATLRRQLSQQDQKDHTA